MDINIKILIQSLDSPMKPIRKDWVYRCPCCNEYLGVLGCKRYEKCNKCNQKLNWEHLV